MCNGFTCSKNTLVGLNIFYILVSFLLIGVAVHGKVSGIVTSLPIIGGITACGIFLLIVSIVGLIGAMKHQQVTLFVYMIVLFCIFIIQFSVSCAALGVNDKDEEAILDMGWQKATNETKFDAEKLFDCCGLTNKTNPEDAYNCEELACYKKNESLDGCSTCMVKLQEKINSAFNAAGGLGLFFSFTELIGGIVACRYRNIMDPFATGAAGAPFTGSM